MGRPPKMQDEAMHRAVVMRSFWPSDDQAGRWVSDHPEGAILAGRVIDVTKDELIDGMMAGNLAKHGG